MGNVVHETVPIQVWADVDKGIVDAVRALNEISGVRTFASCQGTIDEGGPEPYKPYVMVGWADETARRQIEALCGPIDALEGCSNWGYVNPSIPGALEVPHV